MNGAPHWDALVIGGGAAGMMCAAVAGQRGARVLLIDHAARLAEKIRISGGGPGPFTALDGSAENLIASQHRISPAAQPPNSP
ncbi:MAG: NAD(P)/FAD-dependent oxidoreductase, partial [Betaproteobacteria bacterium]